MRTLRACAALLLMTIAACTSGTSGSTSPAPTPDASGTAPVGCPTDEHAIAALFGETITDVQGAASDSTAQVCSFSTSATDVGALSVTYLRFPRPDLPVTTLADARRRYGSALAGHTVVSMPSWGADAFLDESTLPDQDIAADFAWVPGYEIILGMHSDDPHVAQRRELIEHLVAFSR